MVDPADIIVAGAGPAVSKIITDPEGVTPEGTKYKLNINFY